MIEFWPSWAAKSNNNYSFFLNHPRMMGRKIEIDGVSEYRVLTYVVSVFLSHLPDLIESFGSAEERLHVHFEATHDEIELGMGGCDGREGGLTPRHPLESGNTGADRDQFGAINAGMDGWMDGPRRLFRSSR